MMKMKKHPTFNVQHRIIGKIPPDAGARAARPRVHTQFRVPGTGGRAARAPSPEVSTDVSAHRHLWILDVFKFGAVVFILLAGGAFASAQSNGVPKPDEFTKFSSFVTDRNIFDPNRQPHSYTPGNRPRNRTRTRSSGAPGIQLVGTMSYEKGWFAFFNASNEDYKKALYAGEKIAGYTVMEIFPGWVRLQSGDQKEQFELKVGDGLQQENNKWVFVRSGETPAVTSSPASSSSSGLSDSESPAPTTPSTGEQNEVLKRLMQLREKENQ